MENGSTRLKKNIFRYQLLHIKSGKAQITNTLQVVQPDFKRYENVVKQLKIEKLKSEKTLLLNQFACVENHGMIEIKQHIASM